MTPKWIQSNAAVITGPHSLSQYLDILPTTSRFGHALRIQLVAPNILTSTDKVTVTVTVAMDTKLADITDHDIVFGISDGSSFIGFQAHDKANYDSISPCIKFEANIVNNTFQSIKQGTGPLVTSRKYSSEIKIQIKPSEKWGSCHTEHDEGYVNIQSYLSSLDSTKALYLEIFRGDDIGEKHSIKYIVVDVDLD